MPIAYQCKGFEHSLELLCSWYQTNLSRIKISEKCMSPEKAICLNLACILRAECELVKLVLAISMDVAQSVKRITMYLIK